MFTSPHTDHQHTTPYTTSQASYYTPLTIASLFLMTKCPPVLVTTSSTTVTSSEVSTVNQPFTPSPLPCLHRSHTPWPAGSPARTLVLTQLNCTRHSRCSDCSPFLQYSVSLLALLFAHCPSPPLRSQLYTYGPYTCLSYQIPYAVLTKSCISVCFLCTCPSRII